jgi:hypothetical protein
MLEHLHEMARQAYPRRALAVVTVQTGPGARVSCPTSNTLFHPSTVYATYNVHHPLQRYHQQISFFNLTHQIQKMHVPWFFYSALERHAEETLLGRPLWHLCSALPDRTVCKDVGGPAHEWIVLLYRPARDFCRDLWRSSYHQSFSGC